MLKNTVIVGASRTNLERPNTCLSIAESSDGKTVAGRQAFFQDAADAAALDGAGPGSKIDLNGCSGSN